MGPGTAFLEAPQVILLGSGPITTTGSSLEMQIPTLGQLSQLLGERAGRGPSHLRCNKPSGIWLSRNWRLLREAEEV